MTGRDSSGCFARWGAGLRGIAASLLLCAAIPARAQLLEGGGPLNLQPIAFGQLPGWADDNLGDLVPTLIANCNSIRSFGDRPLGGSGFTAERGGTAAQWAEACEAIRSLPAAPADPRADPRRGQVSGAARNGAVRGTLERVFTPYAAGTGRMTGYYEPVLLGATQETLTHRVPLYAPPAELPGPGGMALPPNIRRWGAPPDRAAIEAGALAGRGLEIAWVDDAVDAFFMQIQGSGRIILPNGSVLRIGVAAQNGQPFIGILQAAFAAGMPRDRLSMPGMRAWLRDIGPDRARAVMSVNPSYIFYRRVDGLGPNQGPYGAMGVPLTPRRSLAVDRSHIPLGTPMVVTGMDVVERRPFAHLALAQDVGGMIRGPTRIDYFWGWGDEAGERAGRMFTETQVYLLLPRAARESMETTQRR